MAKGRLVIEIDDNDFKLYKTETVGNATALAVLLRCVDRICTDEGLDKEQTMQLLETTIGGRK